MKIWIEYEFKYNKLNTSAESNLVSHYSRSIFIDPKVIKMDRESTNECNLYIWANDSHEDCGFTFEMKHIVGLLIDVKDKDDFLEMKMKKAILEEWHKNGSL